VSRMVSPVAAMELPVWAQVAGVAVMVGAVVAVCGAIGGAAREGLRPSPNEARGPK
jgi:hypothetical protein